MKRFIALWLTLMALSWPLVPVQAARTFADGQYISVASAIISVTPLSMCAWVRTSAATTSQQFMGIGTASTVNH